MANDQGPISADTVRSWLDGPTDALVESFESDRAKKLVKGAVQDLGGTAVDLVVGLGLEYGPGPVGELADMAFDTDG